MPVLIFISGYLSRRKTDYETYIVKAIKSCLVPFLVFNILYGLHSVNDVWNVLTPKWTLWYLLSLFWWKVLIEIVRKVKWPLAVALLFSIYAGLLPVGSFLSLSRTLGLFPYFVSGYFCTSEGIRKMREANKALSLAALLATMVLAGALVKNGINSTVFFFRDSYEEMGQSYLQGMILRAVLLITGHLCIFSFFSLATSRKTILSNFGMYSLTVYLGHSAIIRILNLLKIINISNPYVFIAFAAFFSLAVAFALGNQMVFKLYQIVIDKINHFVVKA